MVTPEYYLKFVQKLTIKTPERRQSCSYGVIIINFEQISHIIMVIPLFTLNKYIPAGEFLYS